MLPEKAHLVSTGPTEHLNVTSSRFRAETLKGFEMSDQDTSLLSPGLSAAVEIKTGKRSVISFLLSPIARSVSQPGRER